MAAPTFDHIYRRLQSKEWDPVYFFCGLEAYYTDKLTDYLEANVLTEAEQAFNLTVLYGKDSDHKQVVDAARRYPMGADKQLVILKEAQDMRSLSELARYIENPMPSTVLVIAHKHKKFSAASKFGKLVKAKTVFFEGKPLYDNQVSGFVINYLKDRKKKVTPQAAELIGEYLGTDLSKVANELDKLALNLGDRLTVDVDQVEAAIGISKAYNVFELQKALAQGDKTKAFRIVDHFAANPRKHALPMVLASLYNYFSNIYKLHFVKNKPQNEILSALKLRSAFFLKEYRTAAQRYNLARTESALELLREYDLKSKGVGFNNVGKEDGALLKELVFRLMN